MKSALSAWRVQPLVTTSLRCRARYCAGNRCGGRGLRANCNSGIANCLATALRLRVKRKPGGLSSWRILRVSFVDSQHTPAEYFNVCKERREMHRGGRGRGDALCAHHESCPAAVVTLQWRKYRSDDFNRSAASRRVSEEKGGFRRSGRLPPSDRCASLPHRASCRYAHATVEQRA
jgi:hypothetical protein